MLNVRIFTEKELIDVTKQFKRLTWDDGKKSARGFAKDIKSNKQCFPNDPRFAPIEKLVQEKFLNGPLKNLVFTKNIVGIRANSYSTGETYGWHVDFAHMSQKRTDLSFTIFISDKSEYEGGELEMEVEGGIRKIKLQAGSMVLYPTGTLHRVTPVTKGTRLCIVGWIESLIPNELSRRTLYEFSVGLQKIKKTMDNGEAIDKADFNKLNQVYFQMMRLLTP